MMADDDRRWWDAEQTSWTHVADELHALAAVDAPPHAPFLWPPPADGGLRSCACMERIVALIAECRDDLGRYQRVQRMRVTAGCDCFALVFRLHTMCVAPFDCVAYLAHTHAWIAEHCRAPRAGERVNARTMTAFFAPLVRDIIQLDDATADDARAASRRYDSMWQLHSDHARCRYTRLALGLLLAHTLPRLVVAPALRAVPELASADAAFATRSLRTAALCALDEDVQCFETAWRRVAAVHDIAPAPADERAFATIRASIKRVLRLNCNIE